MIKYNLAKIEKVVGEYNIYDVPKIPFNILEVKIYQQSNGKMIGYTNLRYQDGFGDFLSGVGHGENEMDTLYDTIENFVS